MGGARLALQSAAVRPLPLIVLLCLMTLTSTMSIGAFPVLLPDLGRASGLADWQLGIVAGALLVLATFVPLFGRSTGASLVLAVLAAVGVETVRRMIRSGIADDRNRH